MVVVDPKKIAQAIVETKPERAAPVPKKRARGKAKPTVSSLAAQPETAIMHPESSLASPSPVDPILFTIRQLGRTLDDIERLRIMNGNRVGAGQREGIDLPWMDTISNQLDTLEHNVELELKRAWRKHRLAPWAKAIPGAGEILMGRLIAEIGNPADRPNPAKLLAYCGHGDPARAGKIPKGATQEELFKRGSPAAKKAVWKLAYQFMRTVGSEPTEDATKPKEDSSAPETDAATPAPPPIARTPHPEAEPTTVSSEPIPDTSAPDSAATIGATPPTVCPSRRNQPRSPYRDTYDNRKAATEGKLHDKACVRCGPAGHPALPGSEWSDAHRHADALRIVAKRFLIDLWATDTELASK